VLALVIRSGFTTVKGDLVRGILYPKPTKFKFYRDSLLFVFAMALIAVCGFCCLLPIQIRFSYGVGDLIDRSLALVTITVPPSLPAAMTVGIVYSISRLKKSKIFSTSPQRINVAGRVNLMVFDKTGTLTEDGLEVKGFRSVEVGDRLRFGDYKEQCTDYLPKGNWW